MVEMSQRRYDNVVLLLTNSLHLLGTRKRQPYFRADAVIGELAIK
jgi:hypothetical protein